jgi:hypothetical protein
VKRSSDGIVAYSSGYLDNRQLKDIGITRDQAEHEARKPIWKG